MQPGQIPVEVDPVVIHIGIFAARKSKR